MTKPLAPNKIAKLVKELETKFSLEKLSLLPYPEKLKAKVEQQYRFLQKLQNLLYKKKIYQPLPATSNAILNTIRLEGELTGELDQGKQDGNTTIIISTEEARNQLAQRMDLVVAQLTKGQVVELPPKSTGDTEQLGVLGTTESDSSEG
jgi:hypothetical protein